MITFAKMLSFLHKKRRVAPPFMFSQRNNPYCELQKISAAKIDKKYYSTKQNTKKMKNILGLDLGTNSIGWAILSYNDNNESVPQIELGSRIIPMSQETLGKFDSGVTDSNTAKRTGFRGIRRLRERCLQRRERLFRILHTLNFLPSHFDESIGWDRNDNKTYGKFIDNTEPKLAWKRNNYGNMEFLFMEEFYNMLDDFEISQPQLVANGKKVPLDWTIYYLRKKALTQPISKHALAWILLQFNQKRGYYQLRGEEEEDHELKKEEYFELNVVKVEPTGEKRGKDIWYNVYLENGFIYRRSSSTPLTDWIGKKREFIVTTEYNPDGTIKCDKEGNERRSFRAPKPDDWGLQKKKVEFSIQASGKTVGAYIYDTLLTMPSEKVRGKMVRVVERKFYKEELIAILRKQSEFIAELQDNTMLERCIMELYPSNEAHRDSLRKKDIIYLLVEDLLFYQRPLRSKKNLISDCPYEKREYVDKTTGEIKTQGIKCIAKSNPYYQEFRLWQFVRNLRLYSRESITDKDVTSLYLCSEEDYVRLYKFLADRKDITQEALQKDFLGIKKPKGKDSKYPLRWNYVEDKAYPCNETRYTILSALRKANINQSLLDDRQEEYRLWHLLYSVEDRNELISALTSYASQKNLSEDFIENFKNIPPFKKEYGAYSEKAIKKLLSVMRIGSMWNEAELPASIENVLTGDIDNTIRTRIKGVDFNDKSTLRGLPEWLACYVVYGRHSEAESISKWNTTSDLTKYINSFKQHSLRNPIVEQCILETLRTVRDIWEKYNHIDEIHIELGRSMKSTSEQRQRMSAKIIENENTNERIRQLLIELKNDSTIHEVRPYSPMQQDILRIYEEGALCELKKEDADYAEISRISRLATPTKSELTRYKLWLEQKYRSPYTGKTISLTKLFTSAYQIEHIIPQGRYFDDSFSNKVICEAEVNQRKTNMLGMEFIKKCGGEIVHCPTLGDVKVFTEEEYKLFIEEHYASNRTKAQKLIMEDLPEEFIQRQMNDSRYISKVIKGMLSNVVRENDEVDAISKNVIPCTGGITDRLKKDWGLNDIWNKIVAPRFERMNRLTNSDEFGHWENKEGKRVFQTTMPPELQRSFSKKRIDHRHHAMDALVIALANRNIVSYLNNESAHDTERREDLRRMLCNKNRVIKKPWDSFTQDSYNALQNIVVSFKHYTRVINKASNYYEHYNESGKKTIKKQQSSEQWAVRQSLHDQFVFAHVNLKRIKEVTLKTALKQPHNIVNKKLRNVVIELMKAIDKPSKVEAIISENKDLYDGKPIEIYYHTDDIVPQSAIRRQLDTSFNEKKILNITDTGIQKILLNYLHTKEDDPTIAFTPEGILDMNEHIEIYNNGKHHQPIQKVRVCEALGSKVSVGTKGAKTKKYVQGAPHLYLGIYETNEFTRYYYTAPLDEVIERQKQGLTPVPETYKEARLKFWLSPNDLVYAPTDEEIANNSDKIDKSRIYRFISSEGSTVYFLPLTVASLIMQKKEFESLNKSEKAIIISEMNNSNENPKTIKSICWKLEIDRLGKITKIIR